ncbi:MAG: hypothetical protein K2X63_05370 [Burkholderiaceae bacterium]|nr:hypothetical protein [Burkholderiaceae bacterium]
MEQKNWTGRYARSLRHCLGAALSVASVAIVALLCGSSAMAQEAGMKVVKDPQTGELRAPTADEFKKMQAQENAARSVKKKNLGILTHTEEPKLVRHRRGGLKMELTEDSMVYSVLTRNADGSLAMQCVTGADAAQKALNQQAAPANSVNSTNSTNSSNVEEGHHHDIK